LELRYVIFVYLLKHVQSRVAIDALVQADHIGFFPALLLIRTTDFLEVTTETFAFLILNSNWLANELILVNADTWIDFIKTLSHNIPALVE